MERKFGLIAADTSRTRAYLNGMKRSGLLPSLVIVLTEQQSNTLPGQSSEAEFDPVIDSEWPEADFDPLQPLLLILEQMELSYKVVNTSDINHKLTIAALLESPLELFVYSGYGGALLKKDILRIGKNFLHVHGGYLPEFKGSTANYYSLIKYKTIGASAIFLTAEIDGGPVLKKMFFQAPKLLHLMDHIYDSAARTRVLISVLDDWVRQTENIQVDANKGGDTYYIIHPVLKHIAILL